MSHPQPVGEQKDIDPVKDLSPVEFITWCVAKADESVQRPQPPIYYLSTSGGQSVCCEGKVGAITTEPMVPVDTPNAAQMSADYAKDMEVYKAQWQSVFESFKSLRKGETS